MIEKSLDYIKMTDYLHLRMKENKFKTNKQICSILSLVKRPANFY